MKPGIHPDYRHVVFEDSSGGQRWICRSTINTERRTTWEDGEEYPHVCSTCRTTRIPSTPAT